MDNKKLGLSYTPVVLMDNNKVETLTFCIVLMQLTVLPMMEVDEDRDDGWGAFDCEISDRKVAYIV